MKKTDDNEINKGELNEVIGLSKKILKLLYIVFIAALVLTLVVVCKVLLVYEIVIDFLKVISPLFIGFILAWLLRPIVKKINQKINNNTISSLLTFAIFVLIILGLLYFFIPTFYSEVNELMGMLPSLVERATNKVNTLFSNLQQSGLNLTEFKDKVLAAITNYSVEIASILPNKIIGLVISLFSGIGTFGMGLIIGLYLLIDYDNVGEHIKKFIPKKIEEDVLYLANRISCEVRKCVNGTFVVALMVLICDSIGYALVGLRAPLLFGVICGITDLIPFIGPYIGGAAAVIVGITQDPLIGVGTFIICAIVQIIENYILQPIIMSKASQTHPVLIIIALLIFGHFFGIIGMILATPILTLLRVLILFAIDKINSKKMVLRFF